MMLGYLIAGMFLGSALTLFALVLLPSRKPPERRRDQ